MPDILLQHLHTCVFANTQVHIHRLYQHTNNHVRLQMLRQCPPRLWCIQLLADCLKAHGNGAPYYSPVPDTSAPERPITLGCAMKATLFPHCSQWHLLRRWQLAGTRPQNPAQFPPQCTALASGLTLWKLAGSREAQAWETGLDTPLFLLQRLFLQPRWQPSDLPHFQLHH